MSDHLLLGVAGFAAVLVLGALRMPVALALGTVGLIGTGLAMGWTTFWFVLGSAPMVALDHTSLTALPLFILMGNVAVRGGLSRDLFEAAHAFLGHLRGGLAAATIVACAGFGAVNGTSVATVATMSRIAMPEMLRYGYHPRLGAGAIAAGGTLGILIPPSLPLIFYGLITETSIGQLFAAALIPGLIAVALYLTTIAIWTALSPAVGPAAPSMPWLRRFSVLRRVGGVLLLFCLVMGGMYGGIFDATEAAAVGALCAILIGRAMGRLDRGALLDCLRDTVTLSAVLLFLIIGVAYFHTFMDGIGLPQLVTDAVAALEAPPLVIMAVITLILILLGCVMDSIAILFILTPVLFPIVTGLGYDPIWFGILMVMVIEFGLITPPFGMNVFVMAAVSSQVSVGQAFRGVAPFIASDLVRLLILFAFPTVVLWLPKLLFA